MAPFPLGTSPQPSGGPVRADLRDASCSPPPGGGCGLPIAPRSTPTQAFHHGRQLQAADPDGPKRRCECSTRSGCKFRIQYSKFRMPHSGRSLRSARRFGNELRASAGRRLRPAGRCATDFADNHFIRNRHRFLTEAAPQPSGRACDFRGAALRPGAAAGCRSLRDRSLRKISLNK